jgi:tetratricopeptide (TPR) repeat protein
MKTILPIFSLLLLISFQSWGQKHSSESKKFAVKAQHYYDEGNYKAALEQYLKAEKLHPGDPYYGYSVGLCYSELGYHEEALSYLETAKKSGKIKLPLLDYHLGQCYHATMKFDKAIAAFEEYKTKVKKKSPEETAKANKGIQYSLNAIQLVKNPVNVKIRNMGDKINSEYSDYNPVLPVDESTIIYTSRREHEEFKGRDPRDNKFYENIYINVKSTDDWTTPTPLSNIINTPSHDACVGLSADGSQLFIYKDLNGGDLYVSNLLGTIWGEPKSLGPNINSNAWEPCVSISADGKTLFFVSDRKGGIGGTDIYMSKKLPTGEFGPAILLSDKINTTENEYSPFIHPDGKTLYFSSMGYNSMGGYDIFSCTINLETGDILSAPVNVGYPINTTEDDINFVWSADNKRAYFSSVRGEGFGEKDIYILERETAEDAYLSILKGRVFNCEGGAPIRATITITDNETHEALGHYTSNSTTGKYTIVLPGGVSYNVAIDAPGYAYHLKDINLPAGAKFTELNDTVCLQKITAGTILTLKSVQYDKSDLTEASFHELDRLIEMLYTNAGLKVSINVHTDSDGDDAQNLKLTEDRAKAVRDYITAKGIDSKRIFYKGFGETKPLVPNDTPERKALNRRTEIEILR